MSSTVESNATVVLSKYQIVRFHGRAMIELSHPYPHFQPLTKGLLSEVAKPLLGWLKQRHLNHLHDYLISTAPDLSWSDQFVVFGDLNGSKANVSVWDMNALEFRHDISPRDCVWRSPYPVSRNTAPRQIPLIMQLAGDNAAVYDDIMQSLAPLVMACKPEGVVWWVGGDTESKQLLMEAVHRILPNQLAKISAERLSGGRQTPLLNGNLGNVVESGTAAVADVSLYRNLAKHQTFGVHKYRSQDGMNIKGNIHHIFSSAYTPTFSTKTWSTQMRTVIIPFGQLTDGNKFPELTTDFHGRLVAEMCSYAVQIRDQGYRYSLSATAVATGRDIPEMSTSKFTTLSPLFSPTGEFIW
ncbi:MAG: hypothetical protein JWN38_183 [Candidatus Saccharibacteria bacterium]|nr:hypothetical protein [Candidatus Saccharibacteria bacterium]